MQENTIRTTRKALGLTQAEFGSLVGITANYVYLIERGDKAPTGATERLLAVLDVPGVVDRLRQISTSDEPSSDP